VKRVAAPTCSKSCNGVLRGKELAKHAHKARAAWSAESEARFSARMSGSRNPTWRGGATLKHPKGNYKGVRYVRCPPEYLAMARTDGYVMEHRLVVAVAIGRVLLRRESVHHVNHQPGDNRRENMMLFATNRDHKLYEAHGAPAPIWSGVEREAA